MFKREGFKMRNRTIVSVVIVILLLLNGIVMASARLPASGDHVRISTAGSAQPINYEGTITEIGDGFINLKCNSEGISILDPPKDICIGIGAIICLEWI